MQVSVETLGNLERRITFSLPAERIDTQVGGRLREIARTARIKGFRPGKVPTKVIEQRYGSQVRAEILDGLLRESFDERRARERTAPGRRPADRAEHRRGGRRRAGVRRHVRNRAGLRRPRRRPSSKSCATPSEVEDADIDRMIDNLRMQRRSWSRGRARRARQATW